jgi:hypothetical protein
MILLVPYLFPRFCYDAQPRDFCQGLPITPQEKLMYTEPVRPANVRGEEWIRFPAPRQRYQGLSRTTLMDLAKAGKIRAVALRKPGAQRAKWLLYAPSLAAYLDSLATGPAQKEEERPTSQTARQKKRKPKSQSATRPTHG